MLSERYPRRRTTAAVSRNTVLLVDMDPQMPFRHGPGITTLVAPGHHCRLPGGADVAEAITRIPARQFWLTVWEEDTPECLSGVLPRTESFLTASTEEHCW